MNKVFKRNIDVFPYTGGYVTKFGDGVFSQDELEYWNGLYNRIEQYNIQQKRLALTDDSNRKK